MELANRESAGEKISNHTIQSTLQTGTFFGPMFASPQKCSMWMVCQDATGYLSQLHWQALSGTQNVILLNVLRVICVCASCLLPLQAFPFTFTMHSVALLFTLACWSLKGYSMFFPGWVENVMPFLQHKDGIESIDAEAVLLGLMTFWVQRELGNCTHVSLKATLFH